MNESTPTSDPWGDPQFDQAVRDTAYFLWEADGRPQGREQEYWFRALERCLRERDADRRLREEAPPPRDTVPRKPKPEDSWP